MRNVYYQDADVLFATDDDEGILALHCEVQGWSASKYKKMIKIFAAFLDDAASKGHKQVLSFSPNPKFCELFGAKKFGEFEYYGKPIGVMVWSLDQT